MQQNPAENDVEIPEKSTRRVSPPNLSTRTWEAADLDPAEEEQIALFQRCTSVGFYDEVASEPMARANYVRIARDQKLRMSMVFDTSATEPSRHTTDPVHTYGTFPGVLNTGGPTMVPVHKITAVTVSASHRRQGILRRQMNADLAWAAEQGFALAALTASEASIYGRFGFGIASHRALFTLKCKGGTRFNQKLPGRISEVSAQQLGGAYQKLAATALSRGFGSVDGTLFDEGYMLGHWEGWETLAKPKNLRWASYHNDAGELQGLVCFKFEGWESSPPKMVILKLVASSQLARAALIGFVGDHDLIEEVHAQGPLRDPLKLLLSNERDYSVRSVSDELWLRILDPVIALSARGYVHDGSLGLQIIDELGFAAGNFEITVASGVGTARRVKQVSEVMALVQLDVVDLARLYLGDVSLGELVAVGRAKNLRVQPLGQHAVFFDTAHAAHSPHLF